MTKRQLAFALLRQGKLESKELAKKLKIHQGQAFSYIDQFHYECKGMEPVCESVFEQEAIDRFLEWKNSGAKLDHLGRYPSEILPDIQIAKRHGYEIRDNIHNGAKSAESHAYAYSRSGANAGNT